MHCLYDVLLEAACPSLEGLLGFLYFDFDEVHLFGAWVVFVLFHGGLLGYF